VSFSLIHFFQFNNMFRYFARLLLLFATCIFDWWLLQLCYSVAYDVVVALHVPAVWGACTSLLSAVLRQCVVLMNDDAFVAGIVHGFMAWLIRKRHLQALAGLRIRGPRARERILIFRIVFSVLVKISIALISSSLWPAVEAVASVTVVPLWSAISEPCAVLLNDDVFVAGIAANFWVWFIRHRYLQQLWERHEKAHAYYPALHRSVLCALASSVMEPESLVVGCVLEAFVPPDERNPTAFCLIVTRLLEWLDEDPANSARLSAYTRRAYRGRIGPKVATAYTAISLASIGNAVYLDLFSLRALALATGKTLNVVERRGNKTYVNIVNPDGGPVIEIAILGDRKRAHCMRREEFAVESPGTSDADLPIDDTAQSFDCLRDVVFLPKPPPEPPPRSPRFFSRGYRKASSAGKTVPTGGLFAASWVDTSGGAWRIGARRGRQAARIQQLNTARAEHYRQDNDEDDTDDNSGMQCLHVYAQ
jgi:hypothetical protein